MADPKTPTPPPPTPDVGKQDRGRRQIDETVRLPPGPSRPYSDDSVTDTLKPPPPPDKK